MKRDIKALQRRRNRAIQLLDNGVSQAQVARELGVSQQSVSRWASTRDSNGAAALKAGKIGRPAELDTGQRRELVRVLKRGAVLAGYPTELWILPRVRDVIAERFGRRYNEAHVSRILKSLGFSCQGPTGRATQRDEETIRQWKYQRWPAQKNAEKRGQTIIFTDESGLSERPTRVRTWAPRGQTPVLQYSFSWHQISAIAGVTFWQFYFRLFPGSIRAPQLVEFLRALRRQIDGPLLIIWDGLRANRSRLVSDYGEADEQGIQLEFLPAYAPELDPVEYIW